MSYPNTVASLPGRWTYLRMKSHPKTLTGDGSGWKARLSFETDYSNLTAFVLAIVGTTNSVTTTWGGGSMSRVTRLQHPVYTDLYAFAISSEETGEASGTAIGQMYSRAKVTVDFETPPYAVTGDQAFMSWEIDQSAQYTTAQGRKFKFPSGEPIDQEAGAFATLNTYTLTLFNCPGLDDDAIDLCTASPVNDVDFKGKPAGHLLFGGCKSVYQTSTGGVVTFQKSLSFTYRSYPWNQVYKHDGTLDTPLDPDGNPMYATSDFYSMMS